MDYYEVVILPKLLATIERNAPGTTIKATTGLSSDLEKPLRFGDIDLLIDYVPAGRHRSSGAKCCSWKRGSSS